MQTQITEWGAALMPSLAGAMALGLSFGVDGLETAAEIVRNWYLKGLENQHEIVSSSTASTRGGLLREAQHGPSIMHREQQSTQSTETPSTPSYG